VEGSNRSAGRVTGAKSERGDSRGDLRVSQTEARRSRSILGSSGERTRKKVSEFHAAIQDLKTNAIAQSATGSITKLAKQPSENASEAVSIEIPIRSIVADGELSDGLSRNALAKRIERDPKSLTEVKNKSPVKLASYTKERDPDGIAWEFRDEKYYPLVE